MKRPLPPLERLRADDRGSTLVEFAVVLAVFVFLLFGLIDIGRLGFSYVMASKATERAVRIAATLPPACPGLPATNDRGPLVGSIEAYAYGNSCHVAEGLCAAPAPAVCTGDAANATATAIWAEIADLMPVNADIGNLQFSYAFDPNLGFLGGPYTPVVTVAITDLDFDFISPLGALAALAGDEDHPDLGASFAFPAMSASLPAEDLG